MTDTTPLEAGDLDILLNVRSHVGTCALHWHKLAIEVSGLVVGGAVALSGFALTRDNIDLTTCLALAFMAATSGIPGWLLIRHIESQFNLHTNILKKVDWKTKVFTENAFGFTKGQILYPEPWKNSGSSAYKEPLLTHAKRIVLIAPALLGVLVATVTILR